MLVLSRREDEDVIINNGQIIVTVIEIRGEKVRLGIKAPPEIPVHRAEVQKRIDGWRPRERGGKGQP